MNHSNRLPLAEVTTTMPNDLEYSELQCEYQRLRGERKQPMELVIPSTLNDRLGHVLAGVTLNKGSR
jgi:hypothetical protein